MPKTEEKAMTGGIKVVVRVRQQTEIERKKDGSECIEFVGQQGIRLQVEQKEHTFAVDRVFQPFAAQEEVYGTTVQPLLTDLLNGFNVSCIAYGQTSAGKTYTMLGPVEDDPRFLQKPKKRVRVRRATIGCTAMSREHGGGEGIYQEDTSVAQPARNVLPSFIGDKRDTDVNMQHRSAQEDGLAEYLTGVIPRAVSELFERLQQTTDGWRVHASYIEIYNETVRDLLREPLRKGANGGGDERKRVKPINICSGEGGITVVDGATQFQVTCYENVVDLMHKGSVNREVAKTEQNYESSRSHAIFILTVEREDRKNETLQRSQLYLVDLAGSEKVSKTGAKGERLREAGNINTSLLALGNVISILAKASAQGQEQFVTYRRSKLTRILKNSFGGNAKTVLIACCSPSTWNAHETLSTLRFAAKASTIQNSAKVNMFHMPTLKEALAKTHQLTLELKEANAAMEAQRRTIRTMQERIQRLQEQQIAQLRSGGLSEYSSEASALQSHSSLDITSPGGRETKAELPEYDSRGSTEEGGIDTFCSNGDLLPGALSGVSARAVQLTRPRQLTKRQEFDSWQGVEALAFICPLTRRVMRDPVTASDGHSYERAAIEQWLLRKTISPVTGRTLSSRHLYPNYSLMREWNSRDLSKDLHLLHCMPVEILFFIFENLDVLSALRLGRACRLLRDVCRDDYLWAFYLRRDFPYVPTGEMGALATYKDCYRPLPSRLRPTLSAEPKLAAGSVSLAPPGQVRL